MSVGFRGNNENQSNIEDKNQQLNFHKISGHAIHRNASQQTSQTNRYYQQPIMRKFPQYLSSLRQKFSYGASSYKKKSPHLASSHNIQIASQVTEPLRQTMNIKVLKSNSDLSLVKSASGYLNFNYSLQQKSQYLLSKKQEIKIPSKSNQMIQSTKPQNQISKIYGFKSDIILQKIQKVQNQEQSLGIQQIDLKKNSLKYRKSHQNIQEQKVLERFQKKNYIEYYTPKILKTHHNDQINDINILSPQYISKFKKQTSFEDSFISQKKIAEINSLRKRFSLYYERKNTKSKVTIQDFIISKSLGKGKFGTVHMAFHKASGAVFALKRVQKELIRSHNLIDQFILEVKLQSYLNHPFIVKIYSIFDDEVCIYLIQQFMEQGTLFKYLKKIKKLSQGDTAEKIKYLAESIKYLQDRGIAHRDIKPENIILSNDVCKLADFGWATFCEEQRRKTYCGTCDYLAPQILQGYQYDQTVDLWCIGVLTFQLVTGKAPFYHLSIKQTKKKIVNVQMAFPQIFSYDLKSFISGLVQKDPQQRMSIEDVLNHPFIKHIKLNQ